MSFDWSVVWQHRDALIAGTATTILLTVATMAIAVPCGIVVAILRLYGWAPVRALATAYVEFFRNLPLILVVFWGFYVLPILTGLGLPRSRRASRHWHSTSPRTMRKRFAPASIRFAAARSRQQWRWG